MVPSLFPSGAPPLAQQRGWTAFTNRRSAPRERYPSHSAEVHLRAIQGGAVRRVAQERLPDALAQDSGLAARGAQHHPRRLLAVARRALGLQAAGATIQRQLRAGRSLDLDAAEAGNLQVGLRVELDLHVLALRVGAAAIDVVLLDQLARLPAK